MTPIVITTIRACKLGGQIVVQSPAHCYTMGKDGIPACIQITQEWHFPTGLGYTVTANKLGTLADSAPHKDGLWLMDMFTGKAQLVLSLHQLAKLQSDSIAMTDKLQAGSPSQSCYQWLSRTQVLNTLSCC